MNKKNICTKIKCISQTELHPNAIICIQVLTIICIMIGMFIWKNSFSQYHTEYIEWIEYAFEDDLINSQPSIFINNIEDWFKFADSVNNGESYADCQIILNVDLDFTGYEVVPIGNYNNPFMGTLRGNEHTLQNITISSDEDYVGLFGYAQYANIVGINLAYCEIYSHSANGTGGIVGYTEDGNISKCNFSGRIKADEGSTGGIVGNNWSCIDLCTVDGEIAGSTSSGYYGFEWRISHYGTGGIAGGNGSSIHRCLNYADVSINNKDNSSETGGISGCNDGYIESCTNFGKVDGGGIVKSNAKYSCIRGSFNFGEVYAGIAVGSYLDSTIEQCVNFGLASGRYAGDIVSVWGQTNEENDYGTLKGCLYINSSKSGVARRKYFSKKSIIHNYPIKRLQADDMEQLVDYINKNDYSHAYGFIVHSEMQRRNVVFIKVFACLVLFFLIADSACLLSVKLSKARKYAFAEKCMKKGEYQTASELFSYILDYKDCDTQAIHCFNEYLKQCNLSGIYEIGKIGEKPIQWKCIHKIGGCYVLLSQYALVADCINSDAKPVTWECSELYKKLNSYYKKSWFSAIELRFLEQDITILSVDDLEDIYENSRQRRCKAITRLDRVLVSSKGYVYWWIYNKKNLEAVKMPFVTSEGLISEMGKSVVSKDLAVRPIIVIRRKDENFI